MKGATSAKHQPPPPKFYTFPNHLNTKCDGSNHSNSDISKNSSMNDLSVLSPNLKSYLDPNHSHHGGGRSQRGNPSHQHDVVARSSATVTNSQHAEEPSPIITPHHQHHNQHLNQSSREEVYSPHLAALSSPPFRYTHTEDDGLLHSIFSARKVKKKRRVKQRRSNRNGGFTNKSDEVNEVDEHDEDDDDVLGLFSPEHISIHKMNLLHLVLNTRTLLQLNPYPITCF